PAVVSAIPDFGHTLIGRGSFNNAIDRRACRSQRRRMGTAANHPGNKCRNTDYREFAHILLRNPLEEKRAPKDNGSGAIDSTNTRNSASPTDSANGEQRSAP